MSQSIEKHCISIIIPVYNAEKYLARCINSILAQTHSNWETIFVNDGSSDSSLEILNSYAEKDRRFRVINKNNGGPSSARNMGLDALRTEYFCFVDADDSICPDYLRSMLRAAIDNDCDLVVTGVNYENKAMYCYEEGLVTLNPHRYVKCIHGHPVTKLFKRSIINDTGLRFCEDMVYMEDYVFTTTYALHLDKYYVIREPLYNYHHDNEASLTHRFDRAELALEQYLYCVEAPWRIYKELLSLFPTRNHPLFSAWSYTLYNDFWHYYYFSRQFLSKADAELQYKHAYNRHKDFIPHVGILKRVCAPQRHPRLYSTLRTTWKFVNTLRYRQTKPTTGM